MAQDLIGTRPTCMHTGRTARMEIERADGETDCLIQIDDWDFDWQRTYAFTEPKTISAGDTWRIECSWDNPTDEDIDWGDGTGDEMCLGTVLMSLDYGRSADTTFALGRGDGAHCMVPGDGIGREVVDEGIRVLNALQPDMERVVRSRRQAPGRWNMPEAMDRWRDEFDCIFLGALGDPRVPSNVHAKDILLGARFQLDLYINLRPIKLLDSRYCPLKDKGPKDLDIMVFRENTEGLYTGVGGQFKRDTPDEVAIEAEMNTRKGVERIIRAAFEYADQHGKDRVCMRTSPTPCVTATTSGSVPSRPSLPNTPPLQPATSM